MLTGRVIKGRLVGPRTIEIDEALPDDTPVEVIVRFRNIAEAERATIEWQESMKKPHEGQQQ